MSAVAKIGGQEYTGRDLGSIVRREFGRRAGVRLSADPNSPELGTVVKWSESAGAWEVLGIVRWCDGPLGDVESPARESGAAGGARGGVL